jgi:citrate lyase alpha subunit
MYTDLNDVLILSAAIKNGAVADFVTAVSGQRTQFKPLDNDVGRGLLIKSVTTPTQGGRVVLAGNKRIVTYLSAPGGVSATPSIHRP